MRSRRRQAWTRSWLVAALLAASCASPPNKELAQAQGAIDAARAAGAERFAPDEYAAAKDALARASSAVADRDYRLALSNALESSERAQNAARTAATTRARLRGEVERMLAQANTQLAQAQARLKGASGARMSPRARQTTRLTLARVEKDLQEADAALQAEDYATAKSLLTRINERISEVTRTGPRRPGAQSVRRRN